ncbi:hypothetical protein CCAN12_640022 [Capnocytophaga canimorsus]|uniref:Uncharacterized protein n=1 Tax=Capnocytophaga canimorsus TaxID=28188 RepID=A0A0B7H8R3_9FLAO|nr:hypothetical protein [Capnocytophaga canimorsus]CEN36026.1 hypothetical protein CCAN12_640022 [Capnocytophaga canimorsus]
MLKNNITLILEKIYTFWLGVNDTKNTPDERSSHPTRYDMYETKVKFVEGKPFLKIMNFQNKKYKMGRKSNSYLGRRPKSFSKYQSAYFTL